MSLLVFIAHVGSRLEADAPSFVSIDAFREWVAEHSNIPLVRQILMTSRGKIVKYQTLFSEQEIFVYDRNLFASPSRSSTPLYPPTQVPEALRIEDPPDTLADEGSLDAWKTLFTQRRDWARAIVKRCSARIAQILQLEEETAVIIRATAIATDRVNGNSGGLDSSIKEAQRWSNDVLREPSIVLQNWDRILHILASIKVNPSLLRLLRPPGDPTEFVASAHDGTNFHSILSKSDANRAASRGKQAIKWLENQLSELESGYQTLLQDSSTLVNDFKVEQANFGSLTQDTVTDLSEEMQAVVHKIDRDCNQVLNAQEGARSLSAISKSALMHTQNLLPSLMETTAEIDQVLHRIVKTKNKAADLAVVYLQRVSAVESSFAELKSAVGNLEISDDDDRVALDTLTFIYQLPFLYGSLLVETFRRTEWAQKLRSDSAALVEDVYRHKEDENKRRRRWSKPLEHYLALEMLEDRTTSIGVNLDDPDSVSPKTTRQDVSAYVESIEQVDGLGDTLQRLREMTKTLEIPPKPHARRSNAFKSGSIHEAAYGGNSLLLRGDDEMVQTLQLEKGRLEERLKGSESRIRKLEDLLHRQSQIARPAGGSPRASLDRQPSTGGFPHVSLSPRGDTLQYRPSPASSRRVSQNNTSEEKAFVQRILHLESELETEKRKASEAQELLSKQMKANAAIQQQLQEVSSTKQDLMDNFEAQKNEFDTDRRHLTEENRNLKIKVEELEEEIDRISGSFDDRTVLVERNQILEADLQSLRENVNTEYETLQSQIKSLENDQREKVKLFEVQENQHKQEKSSLETQISSLQREIQDTNHEREEHFETLQAIHNDFAPETKIPKDFSTLLLAVDAVARRAASQSQAMQVALDRAKAENEASSGRSKGQEDEISRLQIRLRSVESQQQNSRDELAKQHGLREAIRLELENERAELNELRSRITDGESGSEALRTRVSDEERKVQELGEQIAASNSKITQFEDLLMKARAEQQRLENHSRSLETQLQNKSQRAEEISQLLFLQTDRLTRLLEHCGFSVSRQDEAMVIQRMSRSGATGKESLMLGPTQSIDRTASGSVPTLPASEPPQYIHWALTDDVDAEADQYHAFHHESEAFDMEAFCDAIVKRIKDIEHIARKWQREAKNYRDRFHRANFESQQKIAFRSFHEGDLALFLPTRNQAPQRSWAAFNVGAPHYFLREEESHRLNARDWLLARISRVEERVVDLSKHNGRSHTRSLLSLPGSSSNDATAADEENPFGLSDGLRWYFLDAAEEKIGAPSTPGMAKSTVASAHVDAAGSLSRKDKPDDAKVTRTLAKSLDSRRSSGGSRKSLVANSNAAGANNEQHSSGLKDVANASSNEISSTPDNADIENPQPIDNAEQSQPFQLRDAAGPADINITDDVPSEPAQPRSPSKIKAWDALWSLDLNLNGKGKSRTS